MSKYRILALILISFGLLAGYFCWSSEVDEDSRFYRPFKLGLDIKGGSHLIYEADTSVVDSEEISDAMISLREVLERRINVFGVAEPLVQTERVGVGAEASHRLVIELPGVTDIDEALKMINQTPLLEFKIEDPDKRDEFLDFFEELNVKMEAGEWQEAEALADSRGFTEEEMYLATDLTGRYLRRADLSFANQALSGPSVTLEFDSEGAEIFANLTQDHIDETIGIFLDGELISAPVVRDEIRDGKAEITGQFTVEEARELVRNLNLGALPVPIELISIQTIGATLGETVLEQGIKAALIGFILVIIFMIFYYRLPGLVASISLLIYVALVLSFFKLIPVTLTAASIAGFILSIGIAIDGNVLIFSRIKEEMKAGKKISEAVADGFSRAWLSIRDSNLSSIISAIILFWFGTSLIKGFALTFGLGIIISMFSAVVVSRTILLAISPKHKKPVSVFLFGSGFSR